LQRPERGIDVTDTVITGDDYGVIVRALHWAIAAINVTPESARTQGDQSAAKAMQALLVDRFFVAENSVIRDVMLLETRIKGQSRPERS
jgi:hypothetical protein